MSVDAARDLVFLPTSSASPDFFGGERPGDNRYANSVVALRGSTGEVVWHFQTVHHDIWDYDLAAQPNLVEIQPNGEGAPVAAVLQPTKTGLVFTLDRETGKPLYPVEERAGADRRGARRVVVADAAVPAETAAAGAAAHHAGRRVGFHVSRSRRVPKGNRVASI